MTARSLIAVAGLIALSSVGALTLANAADHTQHPDAHTAPAPNPSPSAIAHVQHGQRVTLRGTIVRVLDSDILRIQDATASIRVYLPTSEFDQLPVGDTIEVVGLIEDDAAFGLRRPQLFAERVTTITSADRNDVPPQTNPANSVPTTNTHRDSASADHHSLTHGETLPIADVGRGDVVTIRGTVERLLDSDEFRIADDSGSLRVYVGWRNRVPARPGDVLTVTGTIDDDLLPIRRELYASLITTPDGRTLDLTGATPRAAETHADPSPTQQQTPHARSDQPITAIADIQPGDIVAIRGDIANITDRGEFRIADDTGSVRVYLGWDRDIPAPEGSNITVIGGVHARGPNAMHREIYALKAITQNGTILRFGSDAHPVEQDRSPHEHRYATDTPAATPADPFTPISQVARGQHVTIAGEVTRVRDDEFVLRDPTGSIEVYIGWRNRMPVRAGDTVTVIGVADDDALPGFRPDIYADQLVLGSGRVILLKSEYDD